MRASLPIAALLLAGLACTSPDPAAPHVGPSQKPGELRWEQAGGPTGISRALGVFTSGDTIFVRTPGSLLRSGAPWTSQPLHAVAMAEVDGVLVASLAGGGLVRSLDAGASWVSVPLPVEGETISLSGGNGALFLVTSSPEGYVALTSGDRGQTFEILDTPGGEPIWQLVPLADGGVLACSAWGTALWRSGAEGWTEVARAPHGATRADLFAVQDGTIFAVAHYEGRAFHSSDGGVTWTESLLPGTEDLAGDAWLVPAEGGPFLAYASGQILRWDGRGWIEATAGLPSGSLQGFHGNGATVVALVGERLHRLESGRWSPLTVGPVATSIPALVHDGELFLAGTAGGRIHTSRDGVVWTQRPLPSIALSLGAGDGLAAAGIQGGGLVVSTDGGVTWREAGDGFPRTEDDDPRQVASVLVVDGVLWIGTGNGFEAAADRLARTGGGVFRSFDGGKSWEARNTGLPAGDAGGFDPVIALAATGETLWASTWFNGLYRSDDQGESWVPAGAGLPAGRPVTGLVEAAGAFHAAVGAGPGEGGGLYRSQDGATWSAVTGLPPDDRVQSVLAVNGALVATFVGGKGASVRFSSDGFSWAPLGSGQAERPHGPLAWAAGLLLTGTDGAGIWRLGLDGLDTNHAGAEIRTSHDPEVGATLLHRGRT